MKAMNNLKIGMLTCISALGLSSCFLAEKPKTFSNNGITITLDNTFFKVNVEDAALVYTSSKGVNILFYQIDVGLSSFFNAFDQSYTLYPIVEGEDYKELKNKGNISYYDFYLFNEGRGLLPALRGPTSQDPQYRHIQAWPVFQAYPGEALNANRLLCEPCKNQ